MINPVRTQIIMSIIILVLALALLILVFIPPQPVIQMGPAGGGNNFNTFP